MLGVVVAYASRAEDWRASAAVLIRTASLGYALPGTVVAIGLLAPLAGLDDFVDGAMRDTFGISTRACSSPGPVAPSSMPMRCGSSRSAPAAVDAGLAKVPRRLDYSARTLGETVTGGFRRVHLPLIRPALGAAALLVFVDCMKELPATLLLRPLNFETLATHLYGEASRGTYEDGAIAALLIVLVGLLPVAVLLRLDGRPARSTRRAGIHP